MTNAATDPTPWVCPACGKGNGPTARWCEHCARDERPRPLDAAPPPTDSAGRPYRTRPVLTASMIKRTGGTVYRFPSRVLPSRTRCG